MAARAGMTEHRTDAVSLRERARRALSAAIIAGELHPGVIYSAPLLAAELGMSATPVREALLDLANQGFVEVVRNRGFRVSEVSDEQLDDIYDLRVLLEIPATLRAVDLLTGADLLKLGRIARRIETAAAAGDLTTYLECDREFHLHLLGVVGNAELVRLVGQLRDRTRLYNLPALAGAGDLIASASEHRELLNRLRDRDPGAVERLMRQHLGHVRRDWARKMPARR